MWTLCEFTAGFNLTQKLLKKCLLYCKINKLYSIYIYIKLTLI